MSSPSSSALKVEIAGRRTEQRLAWLALAAAPGALLTAGIGAGRGDYLAWYVLCFSLAGVLCALGLWREGALGGRRRIRSIAQVSDGRWLLTDARGSWPARLLPGTRVGRGWLWLRWAPLAAEGSEGGARSLLLAGADVAADDMRRLQVCLRLQRLAEHELRANRGAPAATDGA